MAMSEKVDRNRAIVQERQLGLSYMAIGEKFELAYATVVNICRRDGKKYAQQNTVVNQKA